MDGLASLGGVALAAAGCGDELQFSGDVIWRCAFERDPVSGATLRNWKLCA